MTASMRSNLNKKLRDRDIAGKLIVTLVSNLKPGDEFDLTEVPVIPEGYRLIVRAVVPDEGETQLVRVFFEECADGHLPRPARMNGNFPVTVIRA